MYEVGYWFIHLMNLAIVAIVGIVVLVAVFMKRGQYMKTAQRCIQAEIILSTGHSEFHTVRCGINDEWVHIGGFDYKLDPKIRRWGLHPRLPFMGLGTLQCQIRKEVWKKDNPNAYYRDDDVPQVTAAEVGAQTREAMAVAAGAEAVEMDARQRQLADAIANQPNKTYVYLGLGVIIIGIIVLVVQRFIEGG